MKKYLFLFLALPLLLCCSKDDYNNTNPYLPDYNFSIDIDFNLPLYNGLNYPSTPVRVNTAGIGINGIIVMKTGTGYTAFEATCPNQDQSECSILQINGILVKCPCDGVEYSLFDGTSTSAQVRYPLKAYRVQVTSSTSIRVYN